MLIFWPIMLFSNSQKSLIILKKINVPIIPNTLPIILKLNHLIFTETDDMRCNVIY